MTRQELLATLSKTLTRRRGELHRMIAGQRARTLTRNRTVGDSADSASDSEQDELDTQLASVESRELTAIESAMDRVSSGEYGICEACNKKIPAARLTALPYAENCIDCQRAAEGPPASNGSKRTNVLSIKLQNGNSEPNGCMV